MLSAKSFSKSTDFYFSEFICVLNLLLFSCKQIIKKETFNGNRMETFLRNILVNKYLRIFKKKFGIPYLAFEIESGEINVENRTIGFVDIKVINAGFSLSLESDENKYYALECKRLDGNSSKNMKYIDEGILRFVVGKYSSYMPFAGMIGFIEAGCIEKIIDDINNKLCSRKDIITHEILKKYKVKNNFKHSYKSKHDRHRNLGKIDLYHIMFDYKKIMN